MPPLDLSKSIGKRSHPLSLSEVACRLGDLFSAFDVEFDTSTKLDNEVYYAESC